MGVRKTADFLEKATWTLAVSLLVLSVLAAYAIPRDKGEVSRSAIEEKLENVPSPSALPTFPPPTSNEGSDAGEPDQE